MACDDALIVELFAQGTGNNDRAARPGDIVRIDRPVGGADVRHAAGVLLCVRHVLQPFGVERRGVEQVGLALAFSGAVPQPALALVALRAISRDASIIAAHAPHNVLVDAVQQRIGAGKLTRALQGVMDHLPFQRRQRRLPRIASHLDIAKSMVSETRLIQFRALALQRVGIRHLGRADVVQIKRAVGLKRLRVAQPDFRPARTGHLEPAPADHILAQVKYPHTGLRLRDSDWLERFHDADGRDHLGREHAARGGDPLSRLPLRSVEARRAPAGNLPARVILLAVVFVVGADRAVRGEAPGLVANHLRHRPVLILDAHLEQQLGITITRCPGRHRGTRRVKPAIAQNDPRRIRALLQLLSHVERNIERAFSVIRQPRRQHLIANLPPVQVELG